MSVTQKISCVLWVLGGLGVVLAAFSSNWMTGDIGLRGLSGHPWSEIEAHLGATQSADLETAAFLGPVTFWGSLVLVVSALPAAWYFRYGKNIGRLWVALVAAVMLATGIGFSFSISEAKLHYPVPVFFIGIALLLIGSLVGFAEPKQDARSKPLEF
jgi:hypothetical protein